ncbi:MAG: NADH-quinone oxidoreductase subunit NuoH [Candidatus Electrothrix sp. AW2]|jgi:NADH-quinone oxidoreductase subunit H|nr:NADH-quinone oxidoreductase subunit NuoH [Candidatus Electrothrix sp. AX1]MCI5127038.1 NADH-quinone oxidoreductase subunit NuoH [Candidatus Electrothrix gigas]MCI5134429.1 NADH-quinone oxidoreductase subunit NuoH [Candidatus Electrothrix gigas]MCI5178454.1 NADH-quinone oxidoreductase subunit NuoH [Candidatus Electrothrix gigas]MCI5181028.1 NADH-quinone oxidoreductase subunit NuoH [Candidatus Electrothrix gigas]
MSAAETLYPLHNGIGNMVRDFFPESAFYINAVLGLTALIILVSSLASILIYLERKVSGHFQVRLGPMRVGYHGILQPIADGLKLILKEILKPKGADALTFYLAPMFPLTATFLIMAILPYDHHLQLADPAGGVLYVLGISGLTVLGLLLAGWSSNNKLSLLGAIRAAAQMISFEISLALIILMIVMVSGTASLREIVLSQQGLIFDWWIFKLPFLGILAFIMYLVVSTAELNRTPFDLAEAESELTAGFHTEYSGMSFAMFFFAEFVNMFISAALATTFFLGGFHAPLIGIAFVDHILNSIPGFIWFFGKTFFIIFIYMWFRWTFPRLRIDQLMSLEWKMMLPVNLILLMMVGVFMVLGWAG